MRGAFSFRGTTRLTLLPYSNPYHCYGLESVQAQGSIDLNTFPPVGNVQNFKFGHTCSTAATAFTMKSTFSFLRLSESSFPHPRCT
jgi:hypothetical protein